MGNFNKNTEGVPSLDSEADFFAEAGMPAPVEATLPYEEEFTKRYAAISDISALRSEATDTVFQIASIRHTSNNVQDFLIMVDSTTRENLQAPFAIAALESKLISINKRIDEIQKAQADDTKYRVA